MKKWEYKFVPLRNTSYGDEEKQAVESQIVEYGEEGWELCIAGFHLGSTFVPMLVYKREKIT